jgi:hypothetical protein
MADPPDLRSGKAWKSPVATFDGPARYTIRVEGHLSPDWSARLGGLGITTTPGGVPVTELTGELRDQAALLGVLNALYELGLPLLAVVRLPGGGPGAGHDPAAALGAGAPPAPRTPGFYGW